MAHAKLNVSVSDEWILAQAEREPEDATTSVGGLAGRFAASPSAKVAEASRRSLAKFIELSRRRMHLTLEQLAEQAGIELAELVAIEKGDDVLPAPRTLHQLAQELGVKPEPLLELAGLATIKERRLVEAALRFAARSEPVAALSPEEEDALNWFVNEIMQSKAG